MIIMPFAAPALRHKRDRWQLPAPDCRSTLPEKIVAKLDFRSLKQLSGSYMSGELDQTMSDVVYSCRRKDRKGELEISLLVEHKSYRDNQTPLQIGSYLFSAYWQQVKQDKKQLTPIIPILHIFTTIFTSPQMRRSGRFDYRADRKRWKLGKGDRL